MSKEKSIRIRIGHRAYVSKIFESTNEILEHFSGSTNGREKLESLKVSLKDKKEVLKSTDERYCCQRKMNTSIKRQSNLAK